MNFASIDLIAIGFGAFNILRLASYFPQLVAIARDCNGATAISFSSWSIWIGANATTALYAWVNIGDVNLAAISAFNAACCVAVVLLTGWKRLSFFHSVSRPAPRTTLPQQGCIVARRASRGPASLQAPHTFPAVVCSHLVRARPTTW